MNYNFDPDRWYENQRRALEAKRDAREIDEDMFLAALDALERKYEELVERLDHDFELPR